MPNINQRRNLQNLYKVVSASPTLLFIQSNVFPGSLELQNQTRGRKWDTVGRPRKRNELRVFTRLRAVYAHPGGLQFSQTIITESSVKPSALCTVVA